ncbi:MAG: aminomethyltransferase family protein [Pseudomonadota bacterium]
MRKSRFFDFLNRRELRDFDAFLEASVEDEDYINWNGYALPFHWGNPAYEYDELRHRCAIFDSTPFQKIRIRGEQAGALLDRAVTRPVSTLSPMRATYVIFCNDDGTIKDDAILFKFAADDYLLMPSDIDHSPYLQSLCERFEIQGVEFTNESDLLSGMAIQGPASASALSTMGFEGIETLRPFELKEFTLDGDTLYIGRVGFTADLGYECWMPISCVGAFQQKVIEARRASGLAMPGYGLRTLETCRLEGGFVVAAWDFATELDPQPGFERTPFEVGLNWIVNLNAVDFIGRDALLAQRESGPRFVFRQFRIGENIDVEDGTTIFAKIDGEPTEVGMVACSSWSWGLDCLVGNASIHANHAQVEDTMLVVGDKTVRVGLTGEPLVIYARRNQNPASLAI